MSPFDSILFERPPAPAPGEASEPPAYFADLHLDDIVAGCTADRDHEELARVYEQPLGDVGAIAYRHDVFRDLEDAALHEAVRDFGSRMETIERELDQAARATYRFDGRRWLLAAAGTYGSAVGDLNGALASARLRSAGLAAFRDYLAAYAASERFGVLVADTRRVRSAVEGIRYRLRIDGPKVIVSRFRSEPDYSAEVLEAFDKFRQGDRKRYDWRFEAGSNMNHVEAAIIDLVERLEPQPFAALNEFAERHGEFVDPTIERFHREVGFYLGYLEFIDRIRGAGLAFCYPQVSAEARQLEARRVFDLALAASRVGEGGSVVPNDLELRGGERVIVVSGPNQGGKTTFARAVGQLHHLARLGVPVPGERVSLPLVDRIFTHFERQEQVEDLTSKLEDDLRRIHAILDEATSTSLLIMNESFTSTTVADQLHIGRRIMRRIVGCGLLCVVVTFLDELAGLDPAIVSMVSSVDPDDDGRRTFEIVRRPPDGLAYAVAIAEKHRLTYPSLKQRLGR